LPQINIGAHFDGDKWPGWDVDESAHIPAVFLFFRVLQIVTIADDM
jgi:hypothetical protein